MLSKFCLCFVVWWKKLQTQAGRRGSDTCFSPIRDGPPLHFWSPCLSCQEAPFAMTGKMLWTQMRESARSVDMGLCYVSLRTTRVIKHFWGTPLKFYRSPPAKCNETSRQNHFWMWHLTQKARFSSKCVLTVPWFQYFPSRRSKKGHFRYIEGF